jgi:hypothetical protein
MSSNNEFQIVYRNWRGEIGLRRVRPLGVGFSSNEWHEPQWMMTAIDIEKEEVRYLALKDMIPVDSWRVAELLEANNRYLEEARAARAEVAKRDTVIVLLHNIIDAEAGGGDRPTKYALQEAVRKLNAAETIADDLEFQRDDALREIERLKQGTFVDGRKIEAVVIDPIAHALDRLAEKEEAGNV